jgi:hypothetical protein
MDGIGSAGEDREKCLAKIHIFEWPRQNKQSSSDKIGKPEAKKARRSCGTRRVKLT